MQKRLLVELKANLGLDFSCGDYNWFVFGKCGIRPLQVLVMAFS